MPRKPWRFPYRLARAVLVAACLLALADSADLRAQQALYDHTVKVTLPGGWVERRAWEETAKESLPLYNASLEAVAFVHGLERPDPALSSDRLKGLAGNGQLATLLESLLKDWPGEASRFYLMVAGAPSSSEERAASRALKPGEARYLGSLQFGSAQVELAEWISKDTLDGKLVSQFKLRSDFLGRRAEVLVGSVVFPSGGSAAFTACRFISSAGGPEWIKPLVEAMAPVPEPEKARAEGQERVRDMVRRALAAARQQKYGDALGLVKQALALAPQDENALDVQGAVLLQQQKFPQAEEVLRQAAGINPRHENARFNLGAALLYQGKTDEAMTEFEAVRGMSPLYPGIEEILKSMKSQ